MPRWSASSNRPGWSTMRCCSTILRGRSRIAWQRRCLHESVSPNMRCSHSHLDGRSAMRSSYDETAIVGLLGVIDFTPIRSEEHTSELQSLMRISYAVFCLKKKKQKLHANP